MSAGGDCDQRIRLALIGAGRIARTYVEAVKDLETCRFTVVVEPREEAGRPTAEDLDAHWLPALDHGEFEDFDAAVICSPPVTHHGLARTMLEAGRHVLCEKPLTIKSSDARELVEAARKRRLILMMASKFRYVDDVVKAKAILESGLLGKVLLFENSFTGKVDMRSRWNSDPTVAGGGVLIDNGSHSIDLVRYLFGPIEAVQTQIGPPAQELPVEDTVRLQVKTTGGVIGCIDLSWSLQKDIPWYLGIYGTEGSMQIGWAGSRFRQNGSPHWTPFGRGYDKIAAFRRKLANFAASIRGSERPLITAEDALASVEVIEAAYRSAEADLWTPVGGDS